MIYRTIIILLLITTNVYATTIEKNHLEPALSVFTGFNIITEYQSDLVKLFSKAFDANVKIRTIVIPSFEPEYVIGIRERDNKYFAFKLSAKTQYWVVYRETKVEKTIDIASQKKVEVSEAEVEITKQAYKILDESWHQMIRRTKYYNDTYGRGLDGTSYHFSASRLLTGYAWSPKPNTQTGYLVKLAELLGQLTEVKDSKNIEKQLIDTGTRLLRSLK